jgi:V/A-type H+/Na+-transporting ATPase subunit D
VVQVKLTKTQLRVEQVRLQQLSKYLPTLQLKKALLQIELLAADHEIDRFRSQYENEQEAVRAFAALFTDQDASFLYTSTKVTKVNRKYENVAGIEIPHLESVEFAPFEEMLFDIPVWVDSATEKVRELISLKERMKILLEKRNAIAKELEEVSIRVNLFEKILIPRAKQSIRKIKIFLSDQQLASICQAKVAKKKILERKVRV